MQCVVVLPQQSSCVTPADGVGRSDAFCLEFMLLRFESRFDEDSLMPHVDAARLIWRAKVCWRCFAGAASSCLNVKYTFWENADVARLLSVSGANDCTASRAEKQLHDEASHG